MSSNTDIFQNSAYNFSRLPKKTFVIKWLSDENNNTKINLELAEPLIIDELSDIYLDNFTTYHQTTTVNNDVTQNSLFDTYKKSAFVLNINEFNIQTNIAGNVKYTPGANQTDPYIRDDNNMSDIFRNIIIPADALSKKKENNITRSHKSKKLNYVCSINPTTINKITGTITGLDGSNMFNNSNHVVDSSGQNIVDRDMFLAEFVIIARK